LFFLQRGEIAMNRLIECVPNFSEGRNPATVQALIASVQSVPDVWLLDYTMDADHHRSVLTFAGSPEAVGEAALRAVRTATRLIDLQHHKGEHPRVGSTDVVPLIPIQGVTMEECVQLTQRIGKEVGAELGIPVFLYEEAATHPGHVRLEAIRHGELQGLATRMESDPTWAPDFGPRRLHPTAGAIVIGARRPLIAFNVNLKTTDLAIAKGIAKTIRQSDGGWPCLKAIGVRLASRGLVQVSMNLTDYHITPMHVAFQAVKTEAAKYGAEIAGSELIGLVPQEALDQVGAASLQLEQFNPAKILDTHIRTAMSASVRSASLSDFLQAVASTKPVPAGGSVAACVGALAASLGVMVSQLTQRTEAQQPLLELSERLQALVQADVEAYEGVARARKISPERSERADEIEAAMQTATEMPITIAELSCEAGRLLASCMAAAKPAVQSDVTVGIIMAIAASEAGIHTAKVNVKLLRNQVVKDVLESRIGKTAQSLEELRALC
jgi:glutamate formiminotransferase / formiminotetrahydrofolate cyclodeaminase